MFNTKEEAISDFAKHAIPMTDATNKEHAAVLMQRLGKYYYTKIEKGFHTTVWPTAIKYSVFKEEKYFLHTHPNHGSIDLKGRPKDNNPLSGIPGSRKLKDAGDAMVVNVLGYNGIYLVSSMGNVYLYEGVGIPKPKNNTYANNKYELNTLKPVMRGLTKSQYCYKKTKIKKERTKNYKKEPWDSN